MQKMIGYNPQGEAFEFEFDGTITGLYHGFESLNENDVLNPLLTDVENDSDANALQTFMDEIYTGPLNDADDVETMLVEFDKSYRGEYGSAYDFVEEFFTEHYNVGDNFRAFLLSVLFDSDSWDEKFEMTFGYRFFTDFSDMVQVFETND